MSDSVRLKATATATSRKNFVGAFFRAEGNPPYGVFSPGSSEIAPLPYPTPGSQMLGGNGYCDQVAANGASIDGSYAVDTAKITNLINLGVRWTRMGASQFFMDNSHVFGAGAYSWGLLDSAQCVSLSYHGIRPVINLEAGPVEYNATPGVFSPHGIPIYPTASEFGVWCGAVAAHELAVFPQVSQFSIPGNEVNTNPTLFPGGEVQIAAYSMACYSAIKAANPNSYVYAFELNMDGALNPAKFVSDLVALGCKPGTCYDGIAMHLSLRYPPPPANTPCYPNSGGDYTMQCVTDVENASGASIHVLISESVYMVPNSVPDEQTRAAAVVTDFVTYSSNSTIDGVSYANIDECALYVGSYFANGCLIDVSGNQLPAYGALQWLAGQKFL